MAEDPHTPTDDEYEERVEFMRDLLRRHRRHSTRKRLFREKFGDVTHETVLRYESRARARQAEDMARGRGVLRAELADVLEAVIEDAGRDMDRVRAVEALSKLYGLNLETPPVEVLCEQLGITVDEFYRVVGTVTGRTLPDPPPAPGAVPGPPAIPD